MERISATPFDAATAIPSVVFAKKQFARRSAEMASLAQQVIGADESSRADLVDQLERKLGPKHTQRLLAVAEMGVWSQDRQQEWGNESYVTATLTPVAQRISTAKRESQQRVVRNKWLGGIGAIGTNISNAVLYGSMVGTMLSGGSILYAGVPTILPFVLTPITGAIIMLGLAGIAVHTVWRENRDEKVLQGAMATIAQKSLPQKN